jgi:uncharacterized protein YkwD
VPQLRTDIRVAGLAAVVAGALALAPPATASARCPGAGATADRASNPKLVRATLCLLNRQRRKHGLRRLRLSRRLSRAARGHSRDMVRRGYFSHTSLSGATFVDRIRLSGYLHGSLSWMVGENLAWGAGSRSSPAGIVLAWMGSPGHRENILTGRYRHIGIGIAAGAPGWLGRRPAATYTTDFGFKGR